MLSMEYDVYVAHGTGWGSWIASCMASLYPENCVAIHLGTPIFKTEASGITDQVKQATLFTAPSVFFNAEETKEISKWNLNDYFETACVPKHLVYAINIDPLSLAAFFLHRLRLSSDCMGNIESVFSKDEFLTLLSNSWFQQNITDSLVFYNHSSPVTRKWPPHEPVSIPVGVSVYPKQNSLPQYFTNNLYSNVKMWNYQNKGGMFPAIEDPMGLVQELRTYFSLFLKEKNK